MQYKKLMSTYVVPKDVLYKLKRMDRHNLLEDFLFVFATRGLDLLLDEPRTMLVTAKLHDVSIDVL